MVSHASGQGISASAGVDGGATSLTVSWGVQAGAWAILVHGGAGDIASPRPVRHLEGCRAAARAAADILRSGASALDAVQRAVIVLEDDPVFNAGTGACLNADGRIELDAAIMDGATLRGGGVCALPPFVNPIAVARAVLDDGRHVLYAAHGAERFAVERGFARVTDEAMTTVWAREQWAIARAKESAAKAEEPRDLPGTVGAVARDVRGSVAGATSTGGRVNKGVGRVGDSPILGAGTYADNDGGACSATGSGEAILRMCLAKGAIDMLAHRVHPEEAARAAIRRMGTRVGGTGGLILVDRFGTLALAHNTGSMAWAACGQALTEDLAGS